MNANTESIIKKAEKLNMKVVYATSSISNNQIPLVQYCDNSRYFIVLSMSRNYAGSASVHTDLSVKIAERVCAILDVIATQAQKDVCIELYYDCDVDSHGNMHDVCNANTNFETLELLDNASGFRLSRNDEFVTARISF